MTIRAVVDVARAMAMIWRCATESDSDDRFRIEGDAEAGEERRRPRGSCGAWSIRPNRPTGWRPRKMFSATLR